MTIETAIALIMYNIGFILGAGSVLFLMEREE